jgi:hypothetical protein
MLTVYVSLTNLGIFDDFKVIHQPECEMIKRPELVGCEGGQMHYPSHSAIFACAYNLTERHLWFPAADKFDTSIEPHGGITVFDLKTKQSKKLELRNFNSEFSPLGIGLVEDPVLNS